MIDARHFQGWKIIASFIDNTEHVSFNILHLLLVRYRSLDVYLRCNYYHPSYNHTTYNTIPTIRIIFYIIFIRRIYLLFENDSRIKSQCIFLKKSNNIFVEFLYVNILSRDVWKKTTDDPFDTFRTNHLSQIIQHRL